MAEWRDVTDTFSEDERHYNGTYMEKCEVLGDDIEVSYFSPDTSDRQGELYVSFGIMYGISYVDDSDAESQREQMKKEIEKEHEKNNKPSGAFINSFCRKYDLTITNSLFDETALMERLMELF